MGAAAGEAHAPVLVHRDLHDKQVLVEGRGRLGWTDFDTFSLGEAAIDRANLVVHLDLRVAQGRLPAEAALATGDALLAAMTPLPAPGSGGPVGPYLRFPVPHVAQGTSGRG